MALVLFHACSLNNANGQVFFTVCMTSVLGGKKVDLGASELLIAWGPSCLMLGPNVSHNSDIYCL